VQEKKWTGTEWQTPDPKIEVYLPNSDIKRTFRAEIKAGIWSNLQSYNFTESVDDIEGAFSFTTENGEENGVSIFDLIPIRSIVKIYEGGEHPVFVGIIRRRKYNKAITGTGIKQSITFMGKSILSLVAEFMVSLDTRIYNVGIPESINIELKTKVSNAKKIEEFIKITYEHFKGVSTNLNRNINSLSNTQVMEIISKELGEDAKDFVEVEGSDLTLKYNVATTYYSAQDNFLVDVWRNILPKDAYEIFSYCDDNGNPKIKVRIMPFGNNNGQNDWAGLKSYTINPISLTDFELEQTDDTVYTAFASYIIGSSMDRKFYMAAGQWGNDDKAMYDKDKVAIYGFKPLEISFMGFNRGTVNADTEKAIKELNELARYWYSRLDDMYSGTITMITDFRNPETNPRVGCRAKFLGGEFYINKTEHSWNYNAKPVLKLYVSRGMVYDENGVMKNGTDGIIKDVGKKYKELELSEAMA